jgi:hypothetical protein
MIKHDYGIKGKPITVRNPQANAIVERGLIKSLETSSKHLSEKVTVWMKMILGKES